MGSTLDGADWRSCVVAAENEAARIKCSRGWIAGELWWPSLLPLLTVPWREDHGPGRQGEAERGWKRGRERDRVWLKEGPLTREAGAGREGLETGEIA